MARARNSRITLCSAASPSITLAASSNAWRLIDASLLQGHFKHGALAFAVGVNVKPIQLLSDNWIGFGAD